MRDAITTDYADGWRAGWAEGLGAAVVHLRAMAARLRAVDPVRLEILANAALLETAADSLPELPMPAARREATGIEYRGG